MEDKNRSLDDLIGTSSGEQSIKNSGDDKKFLYIILIVLVVLFIIAIGVIAFLGGRYFSSDNNKANTNPPVTSSIKVKKQELTAATTNSKSKQIVDNATINELESLVKAEAPKEKAVKPKQEPEQKPSQEQKNLAKVASAASGGKALSQEDLAKIAKMVAQELSKANATQKSNTSKDSKKSADANLVAQLESSSDTLKNESIDKSSLKDAKANNSAKKVDTFNRVVVEKKAGQDDELSKLSSEIDAILQTEEVKKEKSSYKYKKDIEASAKERANESRFIVVRKGDTLSTLAYKAYGRASAFKKIYAANPDIVKNPNRIYVGMRLRVPVDQEYLKQQGK